jgi:hypothetical protein
LGERPLAFEERPTWEPTTNVERCCVPHYKTVAPRRMIVRKTATLDTQEEKRNSGRSWNSEAG